MTDLFTASRPPVADLTKRWEVTNHDVMHLLRGLPSGSVDCIVTDPPYASLEKHRAKGTTTRLAGAPGSEGEWFDTIPNEEFPAIFAELYRVLANNAHMYVYLDAESMFAFKPMAEAVGFTFWKPLVWDKLRIGMGYHYRARCEFILFFEKGKRRLANLGTPDVLDYDTLDTQLGLDEGHSLRIEGARVTGGYPTAKPVEVSRVLIRQSTDPGALVLDPFIGSGSIGEAALLEGRRIIGNDKKATAVSRARGRLEAVCEEMGRVS